VYPQQHQCGDGVDGTANGSDPVPCSKHGVRAGRQEHQTDEEGRDQTEAKAG
jgi:hypothetical protein